jgi:hypothetical protein
MARNDSKSPAKAPAKAKAPPAPQPANDPGELGLAELGRGILSRDIRPRVSDVRRLAEAILAVEERYGKKSKQAKGIKRDKGGAGKKAGGKKRKLAKIPRQKPQK